MKNDPSLRRLVETVNRDLERVDELSGSMGGGSGLGSGGDDGNGWQPPFPNSREGIHDHIEKYYNGNVYRGKGRNTIELTDGSKANTRSSNGPTITSIEHKHFHSMKKDLKASGWTHDNGTADHYFSHPDNSYVIKAEAGWRGEREITVHHKDEDPMF